jgi:uracil-DNA glycosylase
MPKTLKEIFGNSWWPIIAEEVEKDYFKALQQFVRKEYSHSTCYPPASKVFNAFEQFDFSKLKVVIIGQDPYHGPGQANGLCFSVADGIPFPPSLQNIFKEIETDLGIEIPVSGNLERWAEQGVLLLNATLTVRAHLAGSHQGKGWEHFTDAIIKNISNHSEGIVFMLWGGFAKRKQKLIDRRKHFVLETGHPSPLSANRGYWFGNKHFSKANKILEDSGKEAIRW